MVGCPNCGFTHDPETGAIYDVTYPCPECGLGGAIVARVAARYFSVREDRCSVDDVSRVCHASIKGAKSAYITTGSAKNTPAWEAIHESGNLESSRQTPNVVSKGVIDLISPKGYVGITTALLGDMATPLCDSMNPQDQGASRVATDTSQLRGRMFLSTDISWKSSSDVSFSPEKQSIISTESSTTTDPKTLNFGSNDIPLDSESQIMSGGPDDYLPPMGTCTLSCRVAGRFIRAKAFFEVGDYVWLGKYKNKLGQVIAFGEDAKGNPTITVRPVPQGRKQDKTFSLFKVWKVQPEQLAELKAKGKLGD